MASQPPFLSIKFIQGRALAPKDDNGFSDPYCKFSFNGAEFITKVKTKTLNPIWNQTILLGPFKAEDVLNIECYDKDLIKSDDFMGQINIPLKEFADQTFKGSHFFQPKWYPLQGRGKKNELISGDLEISFRIEPYTASKLNLLPKSAQTNIKQSSNTNPDPDANAKLFPVGPAAAGAAVAATLPQKEVAEEELGKQAFVATLINNSVLPEELVSKEEDYSLERIAENREYIKNFMNRGTPQEQYHIGRVLGKGAFGEVNEGIHKKTGEKRAIKFISKSNPNFSNDYIQVTTESEIEILCSISQDNIVQMKDLFIDEKQYCIILELVTGGELFDKIVELTSYSEQQAATLIKQVFTGIHALHEKNIVHRDLKPENLLLSSKEEDAYIKIADFGLAKKIKSKSERMSEAVGTLMYIAPEIIKMAREKRGGNENPAGYSMKVDVWSAGVILYIMMCGMPPFYDEDDKKLFDQILSDPVEFPSPEFDIISDEAKHFIMKLLERDPEKRLSAAEALNDPWITRGESGALGEHNLPLTVAQLKKFNARRRLRAAILATKALNKLKLFGKK